MSTGVKVGVFDVVRHAQHTCALFRDRSDKRFGYALGIGGVPEEL